LLKKIPKPISGGLVLSYKCTAKCRHCIYACSPGWNADWIPEDDLEMILSQLAGKILSAPHGPRSVGLNEGLHFTGGEPFANFELLLKAVEVANRLKIPSTFVETNGFWAKDDSSTKEKLKLLRSKGLRGIMISVNPFYLEYVPFERTERAVRLGVEVFGRGVMVYQIEYFRRFAGRGFKDKVPFEEYLEIEGKDNLLHNVEFLMMGRAPYRLKELLKDIYPLHPPERFFGQPCGFLRGIHNHFDNHSNYVPGFCAGVSFGDCRKLDELLKEGVDTGEKPVLGLLMDEDLEGLLNLAKDYGYAESGDGYFSKCHLCTDLRRHLALKGDFMELGPKEFYLRLD
jgi:hypothetical protein